MSAWAVGILGIAGVVVGVLLQWVISAKQRRSDRAKARLLRVAGVVGQVRSHLTDLQPTFVAHATADKVQEFYRDHWRRLRAELNVAIATEPPSQLRDDLATLDALIGGLFSTLMFLVSPVIRQLAAEAGDTRNYYDLAVGQYDAADDLARKIIDELHGSEGVERAKSTPPELDAPEPGKAD
jgi:hypothetical protein